MKTPQNTKTETAEIAATEQQVSSLRNELETNQGIVASAAADAQAAQLEAARAQQAATLAAALLTDTEVKQEERRREMLKIMATVSSVRNEMVKSEEQVAALEVLTARTALLQAESQLADALAAANTARADLDRALGLSVPTSGASNR